MITKNLKSGSGISTGIGGDMSVRLFVSEDGEVLVQKYKTIERRNSDGQIIDIKYDILDEKRLYWA